jgi:hypothetical protein
VYLQQHGAEVESREDPDRAAFLAEMGVPDEVGSCHTAVVEGYVVEGHVPVWAIVDLLTARPDAIGIALPGMPGDSPGMGGDTASWDRLPVVLVGRNGEVGPFA